MLNDVEIRQLRALCAVVSEGSFGRAATRLGFSQSAVSQQIGALERAVGDKVFDRPGGPRAVELTPVGALLLEHATTMLGLLRETEDGLRSLRAGEVGRLVIGSYQSVSVKVLPDVIGRIRSERPGLTIRCFEDDDDNDGHIARLLNDDLDLTFLIGVGDHDLIDKVELLNDPFVLLSPVDDVVPKSSITEMLSGPLIGHQAHACQLAIDAALHTFGIEPDYVFRTNDNAAVQAMVRAGMGRAILPYLSVDPSGPGVVITSMERIIVQRVISLARRRHRTLIPAADRFVELATSVCNSLPKFEPERACV